MAINTFASMVKQGGESAMFNTVTLRTFRLRSLSNIFLRMS